MKVCNNHVGFEVPCAEGRPCPLCQAYEEGDVLRGRLKECQLALLDAASVAYPVGAEVLYRDDTGYVVGAVIASQPWLLSNGTPVVRIRGRCGGVLLTRISPVALLPGVR